jgi:hypothetical protein
VLFNSSEVTIRYACLTERSQCTSYIFLLGNTPIQVHHTSRPNISLSCISTIDNQCSEIIQKWQLWRSYCVLHTESRYNQRSKCMHWIHCIVTGESKVNRACQTAYRLKTAQAWYDHYHLEHIRSAWDQRNNTSSLSGRNQISFNS